jgi:hypothetical protein
MSWVTEATAAALAAVPATCLTSCAPAAAIMATVNAAALTKLPWNPGMTFSSEIWHAL